MPSNVIPASPRPAATSARPEWSETIGTTAQAAASAATIPNASGSTDGTTTASASGTSSCSCS